MLRYGRLVVALGVLAGGLDCPAAELVRHLDWARDVTRDVWPMLAVIEAEHVAPPARQELFAAALRNVAAYDARGKLPNAEDSPPLVGLRLMVESAVQSLREPQIREAAGKMAAAHDADEAAQILASVLDRFQPQSSAEELTQIYLAGLLSVANCDLVTAHQQKVADQLDANRYVGIGVTASYDQQLRTVKIGNTIANGPAARCGLRQNDPIVSIDGRDMRGLPMNEILPQLRGEEGTSVEVGVLRKGEPLWFDIVRNVIPLPSVEGSRLMVSVDESDVRFGSAIGMVSVSSFHSSTLHELREQEARLRQEGCRALILDLRLCGGGSFHNALLVADGLLSGGTLATTVDRQGHKRSWQADRQEIFRDWPMVVLVGRHADAPTATVIQALARNGRAKVLGMPLMCEPWLRQSRQLSRQDGYLLIPTARLESTPPGVDPRAWHFDPDVLVASGLDSFIERRDQRSRKPVMLRDVENTAVAKAIKLLAAQLNGDSPADAED